MKLWDIAHSRTGDKGNISNISLIAYDPKDYELLREKVTAEKVKEHFKGMVKGEVVRYELPNIHALNFVMYAAHADTHKLAACRSCDALPKRGFADTWRNDILGEE